MKAMNRPNIAEFQARLKGLVLGHGTNKRFVSDILSRGLVGDYVYSCVEEGWEMHDEEHVNIQFSADCVADRTYPDPEGQWGEAFAGYSMEKIVEKKGLDAVLDELEECFAGNKFDDEWEDLLDPRNFNLVTIGSVPADAILKEKN